LDMNPKQKKAYKSVRDTVEYEDLVDAPNQMAQFVRLRQIALAPRMLGVDTPSPNQQYVLDWLDDNPGEQLIVFSTFSSYLKERQKEIKGSALIIGETSTADRAKAVGAFQEGRIRVILANVLAGGVGLTLDRAGTIIFLDKDFVPANNEQAEDRIVPTTEDKIRGSQIITLSMKDSVDARVHEILDQKKDVIKHINNIGFKKFIMGE